MKGIFLHTIMKNNDQWFEPGDKVMRVKASDYEEWQRMTPFGKVFCVKDCWICLSDGRPTMRLVGLEEHTSLTERFRKVEEIQLCVRAAEAMKNPKKQEEMV